MTILDKIVEVRGITPKNKPCQIALSDLSLRFDETALIFEKLAVDEKIIKIISKPTVEPDFTDRDTPYVFTVLPTLDEYYGRIYQEDSLNIDRLSDIGLLRLYDLSLDINEALELSPTDEIEIRFLPPIIRYRQLFPGDTPAMRDEYIEHRWRGLEFLQANKIVRSFSDQITTGHRWDTVATILVNRALFDRFHDSLYRKINSKVIVASPSGIMPQTAIELPRKDIAKSQTSSFGRPAFDAEKSLILLGKKQCLVPRATFEYYICLLTFQDFGKPIPEQSIIELVSKRPKEDSLKSVYDAHRRLNGRVEETLGIEDLFEYKQAQVWIREELFEPVPEVTHK